MSETSRTIVAFASLSSDALREVRSRALGQGAQNVVDACDFLLRKRNTGHQRIADSSSGELTAFDASIRDQFGNVMKHQIGYVGDPMAWMKTFMSGGTITRINTALDPGMVREKWYPA